MTPRLRSRRELPEPRRARYRDPGRHWRGVGFDAVADVYRGDCAAQGEREPGGVEPVRDHLRDAGDLFRQLWNFEDGQRRCVVEHDWLELHVPVWSDSRGAVPGAAAAGAGDAALPDDEGKRS